MVLNLPEGNDCLLLQDKILALKRFKKILKWFFLSLLLLILALYIFIQTPFGQNWIGRQVTKRLSRELQTKISIKHIDFSLFNNMHLEGVMIEDRAGDTLLYAGDMKVRITDWFFFKKEAELKYVGLENAVIHLQRKDSVWQHQFILDYFSSPTTGTKKKKAGIRFNLKKVELKNVTFVKKDGWMGNDLSAHVASMNMDADNLYLAGNEFEIRSLILDKPVVSIRNYKGTKPKVITDPNQVYTAATSWNSGQTLFKIGNVKITNGTFINDKETERLPFDYFDGQHMVVTEINGEISNASFVGDTVFSRINLSAKERSGFELKKLDADLRMTPQGMAFSNMELVTNRSTIRHFFSMNYEDMRDMGDFIHKVRMTALFDDSFVDSDDIAFFAPALKKWKKEITLQGKVRGTVDDLVGREMLIQAGNSTLLNGDITMTGLPDIERTFIDFKANDFRTTYGDAVTIVPALRKVTSPDLRSIRYVNFRGSFTGFIRDFVTFGTIQTNLGTVKSDLNMKLPRGQEPAYSGSISTDHFMLGQFLGDPNIGAIAMTGTVKGRGFKQQTLNTMVDGTVRYVEYKDYRYNNIEVKGTLNKKLFEGVASMRDPNADLDLNGIIDLNSATPRFDLVANVNHANLARLLLTKDSIEVKGKFNFNFTSSGIDDFLGTARISDAEITKDGRRLPFDSLVIQSSLTDSGRLLTAVSNEFTAELNGDFNISGVPDAITYLLNKYYPAYVKAPARLPQNQAFSFNITTQYADEYVKLIDSSLSGFNFSTISGRLDLDNNIVQLRADVPQFSFRGYDFNNVDVTANGSQDKLSVQGNVYNIRLNDSLNIPMASFKIDARNDSSRVSITSGANRTVDTANLNALVLTYHDGVKIDFDPSTFTINGKLWSVDENGELEFRSNTPASGSLVLRSGEQRIMMRTDPSPTGGKWNDLKVELTKINLGDFSPFFLPKNRLEGLLSGNVVVENPTGNMKIRSDDIHTEYLRLDEDSLGEATATLSYDNSTGDLIVKGSTTNPENYLGFDAKLNLKDKTKAVDNIIALKARNFQINILERFLGNLFSDMQGYLTGDINVEGPFDEIRVTGKGRLKDAGLKVNFTQCFYKIRDTDIELTPEEINLDGIVLIDTVTGNPIYIIGGIEHRSFKNMFYNLDITTRKPNTIDDDNNKSVLLINTTYKDNKQFFGYVKGTGSLSLLGPQENMYMKIDAIASETDSSYVTIPSSITRESGLADFLVERKYGREMTEEDLLSGTTNATYDVDVTANPMVNVKVVLDDLTGDEIKGRGSGTLNIRSGTSEPLSLRGRFDIIEGSYLFTFQSFFKKPFVLREGAENYIEWNGDPYDANIKFEASYLAERVSFQPLANSLSLNTGASNARGDVYVVAKLTDKLFKPTIKFSLDFPNSSVAVSDPELALVIQQMQKNENELNRQVTYLIVFNSFAPSDLAGNYSNTGWGLNTISGILLNVVSDQINKILGNLLKDDKYSISLNTSIYNRNIIDETDKTALNLGSNVNFSIGRSFFNNRFIISTGVGFDAPLAQQSNNIQQSILLLPDVTLEWLVNPSGSLRASFFYRENADYLSATNSAQPGRAKRIGASFSFKRDFNRLGDIFRRKNKPKPALPPPAGATEVPATLPERKDEN